MRSRSSRKEWLGICILFILASIGLSTLTAPVFGERYIQTVLKNYLLPSVLTGMVVVGGAYWLSKRAKNTT